MAVAVIPLMRYLDPTMNWKALIQEILESGMTQAEVAKLIGCGQSYVSDLANGKRGKSMSYEIGARLIQLHKRMKRKAA